MGYLVVVILVVGSLIAGIFVLDGSVLEVQRFTTSDFLNEEFDAWEMQRLLLCQMTLQL